MRREELARKLSEQNDITRAEARDEVDELVRKILQSLRDGKPVVLPGVGRLVSKPPVEWKRYPQKGSKR